MTAPVSRVGDLADAVAGAVKVAPARLGRAWRRRICRRLGIGSGAVVLLVYLLAIRDLTIDPTARRYSTSPPVTVAADWVDALTATRAPYLFEPVVSIRPAAWLVVFVSPGNLLLGGLLATLVTLHMTLSAYQVFTARSCRASAFGRLVAVLPAFGVGMACCTPTLLLALGTGLAAALAPVFVPLRAWLFPLSVALLLASLLRTVAASRRTAGGRSPLDSYSRTALAETRGGADGSPPDGS